MIKNGNKSNFTKEKKKSNHDAIEPKLALTVQLSKQVGEFQKETISINGHFKNL